MVTQSEGRRPGEFLVSEANGTLSRESITIAAGSGVIEPGTVLGRLTAAHKYKPYDTDNVDGSGFAVAIAYSGVDATATDKECVVIYRLAEVKMSCLVFVGTNDASDISSGLADLAAKNIIAR